MDLEGGIREGRAKAKGGGGGERGNWGRGKKYNAVVWIRPSLLLTLCNARKCSLLYAMVNFRFFTTSERIAIVPAFCEYFFGAIPKAVKGHVSRVFLLGGL